MKLKDDRNRGVVSPQRRGGGHDGWTHPRHKHQSQMTFSEIQTRIRGTPRTENRWSSRHHTKMREAPNESFFMLMSKQRRSLSFVSLLSFFLTPQRPVVCLHVSECHMKQKQLVLGSDRRNSPVTHEPLLSRGLRSVGGGLLSTPVDLFGTSICV